MMGPPRFFPSILIPTSVLNLTSLVQEFSLPIDTTPEEALRALEVACSFLRQRSSGFLEYEQSLAMGKVMEKLSFHS